MNTNSSIFSFSPKENATAESHIIITVTDPSLAFDDQLGAVLQAADDTSRNKTVHFRRFFLSDAANQAAALEKALKDLPSVPTSIVQQAPLNRTKIALWLYCTSPMDCPGGIPSHNGYSHRWEGSLSCPGEDSREQMWGVFHLLEDRLGALKVARNTVRTWIFVRDVDRNYAGIVEGRKDYFNEIGLTADTHYIASTGIEGRHPDFRRLVEMDAYTVGGLHEGQLRYLYAKDHLSPTYDYGVTFERGSFITYGDRRHIFISGTASIDAKGRILHEGNVALQAGRMLENISALLAEAGASLKNLAVGIVYLRDPSDEACVRKIVSAACPALPVLFVQGAVCRPSWLVEMECIAITPDGNPAYPDF